MTTRTRAWDNDPELKAEAAKERAERKPNGHDRGAGRLIELVPFGEMAPDLSGLDLVDDLLGTQQTSLILGQSNTGKTFAALDIALRVATGRTWFRRRVTKGPVVYIAAEAGKRIYNRVEAWRRHVSDDEGAAPFFVVPRQIDLCTTEDDLDDLVAAIRKTCGRSPPVLIVVDTVARVMAGADESSSTGMGALIAAADQLRDEFGAHVCLIHHLGKDSSRGARGHSSLHAAVDTVIEVTRDDDIKLSTAKVVKQRDGETGEKIHFALRVVTIGTNPKTGKEVTSCVVCAPDPAQLAQANRGKKERLTGAEQIALNALRLAIETDGEAPPASANCPAKTWIREEKWRDKCYADGISSTSDQARRKAFQRARDSLVEKGEIGTQDGHVWPCGS